MKINLPKQTSLENKSPTWVLYLYVAGQSPRAISAFKNLKSICEDKLKGIYKIEVIDLIKNPTLCKDHQILAVPAVVRKLPAPVRKIIGDLSNTEKVLIGLDLKPKSEINNEEESL